MQIVVDETAIQKDLDDFDAAFKECEKVNDKYGRVTKEVHGVLVDLGAEYQKAMHRKVISDLQDEVINDFLSQLKLR